jgi:putative addiction module killer protein
MDYIVAMIELKQTAVFSKWESRLRDKRARTMIAARLTRLAHGLPGDVEPVGEGVSELRIHYGPGYRVYFQQRGNVLIVLLCGGDKGSQARDIANAKKLAKEWSE